MFQKEFTKVEKETDDGNTIKYKFLSLSSDVPSIEIATSRGSLPFGVNDTKTGFFLDLDKSKKENQKVFEKIKQYEEQLKEHLIANSDIASDFDASKDAWGEKEVSDCVKTSIDANDNYGFQMNVKLSKKSSVFNAEKKFTFDESIQALQPRTKVKLVLTPGVVGFNEKDKTCRLNWHAKEILLVKPDDSAATVQKKFLRNYVLGNYEDSTDIFVDDIGDDVQIKYDKMVEYPNKGKALLFYNKSKYLLVKTGVGRASFGIDVDDEGKPSTMRFMLKKDDPTNQKFFNFFQKFEEELLDKLVEEGVEYFSLKGKQKDSWNKDKAVDRLVECVQDTDYGYDMKIKIPVSYESKANLFRVFDEDGKELEGDQIRDRLYGDNGKNQQMSLLLQVSSVSFYATQCRIVLKLAQARLMESSSTGSAVRTLVDSEDEDDGEEHGAELYGVDIDSVQNI